MRINADEVDKLRKETNELRSTIQKNSDIVRTLERNLDDIVRKIGNTKYVCSYFQKILKYLIKRFFLGT